MTAWLFHQPRGDAHDRPDGMKAELLDVRPDQVARSLFTPRSADYLAVPGGF
jgi:hypothetical protein